MRGILFEVIWSDQDVIEYRVQCSNGLFSGDVTLYSGHDDLRNAAVILAGFPVGPKDSRTLELGTFEARAAGGGMKAEFSCVDSAGHVIASVRLRADGRSGMGEAQSVCLEIPVEAGAIDSFVSQAHSAASTAGAKAYLHMADHTTDWVRRWFKSI